MQWLPVSSLPDGVERPETQAGPFVLAAMPSIEEPPPKLKLSDWRWEQHQLDSDVAADLGFSLGAARAGRKSRTIVAEFSRSATSSVGGAVSRWGVSARLIVKVAEVDAGLNLTLPVVAAKAQVEGLEAYASMRLEGYRGEDASALFPAFGTFNVENYVRMTDALNQMKDAVGATDELIAPTQLWRLVKSQQQAPEVRMRQGVGTAWALSQIKDGHTCAKAVSGYRDQADDVALNAIRQTYLELVDPDESATTDATARARARTLLDGYELRHPVFS